MKKIFIGIALVFAMMSCSNSVSELQNEKAALVVQRDSCYAEYVSLSEIKEDCINLGAEESLMQVNQLIDENAVQIEALNAKIDSLDNLLNNSSNAN